MTFRAKPVVKRDHRPSWEAKDRRNFYLNLGFGLIVVIALLILGIAAGLTWYNAHLAPVGSVDGETITTDEFNDRLRIEAWRLDEATARVNTAVLAGRLTEAQGTAQKGTITQIRTQLLAVTLERLIDTRFQAKLAEQEGVAATPEAIDARLLVEATTVESRHAWVIEVAPVTDLGATTPTAAQKAEAKAIAETAVKDINGGKPWEDVAKTVSTDASTAPQAGDLGWLTAADSQVDETFLKALFAVAVNTPTDVIEGPDGILRVGRVTEVAPESVDNAYEAKFQNQGITLEQYRAVIAGDVIHDALQDKIAAGLLGAAPQRRVAEVFIQEPQTIPGDDAVKVRHILYGPNGDPNTAADLDPSDPAWAAALSKATTTYARLKADPNLFDAIARKESEEPSAQGPSGSGGKLPYFGSDSNVDAAFKAAILVPGLIDGQILTPVRSAFGWHVIQIMYRPTDSEQLTALKAKADGGDDFAVIARDNSEAATAASGGNLGWVAKGQLAEPLIEAIFAAPLDGTSEVVAVAGDGTYLFKVLDEETRTPEGRQREELTSSAFTTWYAGKKAAVVITRNDSIANSGAS